jgi:hypothetical protein
MSTGGFVIATYATYSAEITEFVEYYRAQGAMRIYVYVGRTYVPTDVPVGDDVRYIAWGDADEAAAEKDANQFAESNRWFAWVSLHERYYVAHDITLLEYLSTITASFNVVRIQAHLARPPKERGHNEIPYAKEGLPWSDAKVGVFRRGDDGVLDSGVAKKLHMLGREAPLPGTVYTARVRKS